MTPTNVSAASDERMEELRQASERGGHYGPSRSDVLKLIARIDELKSQCDAAIEARVTLSEDLGRTRTVLARLADQAQAQGNCACTEFEQCALCAALDIINPEEATASAQGAEQQEDTLALMTEDRGHLLNETHQLRAELKRAKEQHIEVATNLANQVAELTRERDEARKEAGDLVEEVIAKHNTMIGLRQQLAEAQRGVERLTHSWSEICANKESMIQTLASQAKEQQARTDDLQRQLDEARAMIRSLRTGLLCGFNDSDEEAKVLDRSSTFLASAPPQAGDESGEESSPGVVPVSPSSAQGRGREGALPASPPCAESGMTAGKDRHQSQASGCVGCRVCGCECTSPDPQPASVTPTREELVAIVRQAGSLLVRARMPSHHDRAEADSVLTRIDSLLARLEIGGGEEK